MPTKSPMPPIVEAYRHTSLMHRLPRPVRPRAIRQAVGVSQQSVGNHVGVSGQLIGMWESGKRTPGPSHLAPYIELLEAFEAIAQHQLTGPTAA